MPFNIHLNVSIPSRKASISCIMRSQRKSLLLDVSFPKYNGLAEISKIGRKKPTPENKHAQTKVKHTGVSSKARGVCFKMIVVNFVFCSTFSVV
jgi:hypothetical protein